jgi:hypothetical protein
MTTIRGSAHYAGLLPVGPSDMPSPIHTTTLKNDFPNEQPALRKRALRSLSRFLIAFCTGVAAMAWWSYGDAARPIIANSYPELGWLAPQAATVQKAPDTIALAGSAVVGPDQLQLDAMLGELHAMRLSLDRIAAGQELITRSIDEIATSIAAGQERMTRSTDQTATSVAAGQEPRQSTNQTAASIAAGQEQITRNTDQTATDIDQAPSKPTSIPVESRTDGALLQPTARLNIKPTEARPPQTSSERGKQLSAASGHNTPCFPSASAVVQNHPGGWPTWTLRAPGHEGTMCWYAASRPKGSDHRPRVSDPRSEKTPEKEIVGTTESGLSEPPARYEWQLMGR